MVKVINEMLIEYIASLLHHPKRFTTSKLLSEISLGCVIQIKIIIILTLYFYPEIFFTSNIRYNLTTFKMTTNATKFKKKLFMKFDV